jgi:hypothetical protein
MPIADWKKVYLSKPSTKLIDMRCSGNYIKAFDLPNLLRPNPLVYTNCCHNELVSFNQRLTRETKPLRLEQVNFRVLNDCIDRLVDSMLPHFECGKYSIEKVIYDKKGKIANRYRKAYIDLYNEDRGINDISRIKGFLKNEKYHCKDDYTVANKVKSPRMIMGRDPRFTLMYLQFMGPIEHALTQLPQVACAKNMFERGDLFANIYGEHYAKTDYSKFESSKTPQWIYNVEFEVYRRLYQRSNNHDLWAELLPLLITKLSTRGRTCRGLRFKFDGCQLSGDADTLVANTISNYILASYFCSINNLRDNFIVTGDDGVIRLPRNIKPIMTFDMFGFDIDFEMVTTYHEVDFCSSKFIMYQPGKFVQLLDLWKVLGSLPYMINSEFDYCLDDYYASLGHMYAVVYQGIPVYEDLGHWMRSCVSGKHFTDIHRFGFSYGLKSGYAAGRHKQHDVDSNLVLSELHTAFNITHAEITALQAKFSSRLTFPAGFCGKLKKTSRCLPLNIPLVEPTQLVEVGCVNVNKHPVSWFDVF